MLSTTQEAQEYRKKFHQYYYDNILPLLKKYENSRKSDLSKYRIFQSFAVISVLAMIVLVAFFILTNPQVPLQENISVIVTVVSSVVMLFIFLGLGGNIIVDFNIKVKEGIIGSFLAFFGDFKRYSGKKFSVEEIVSHRLFDKVDVSCCGCDSDFFEGTYKNIKVTISEALLLKDAGNNASVPVFDGVLIKIKLNKNFETHTIIIENSLSSTVAGTFLTNIEKIELEDPEFNQMFQVYSNDQIESRYILTAAFMERFKNLKDIYKTKNIRASFIKNSMLIAIPCKKNMFEIGDFRRPITDTGEIQELFEEFMAVLSIVDLLKLSSKVGL